MSVDEITENSLNRALGPLHPVYRRLLLVVNRAKGVHAAFGRLATAIFVSISRELSRQPPPFAPPYRSTAASRTGGGHFSG